MNVVHKVAVLFHANDRLSGRLAHMQGKFASLSKTQSEYAKSMANLERIENKAIETMRKHEAATQQAQMRRMQMNRAENARQRAMDAFGEKSAQKFIDLQNRINAAQQQAAQRQSAIQENALQRREAIQRRFDENLARLREANGMRRAQADRQIERLTRMRDQQEKAHQDAQVARDQQHQERRQRIIDQFNENRRKALAASGDRREAANDHIDQLTRQREHLVGKGHSVMSQAQLAFVQGQIATQHSEKSQLHALRGAAMDDARRQAIAHSQDPIEAARNAAHGYNNQLSDLEKSLAYNKQLVDQHHQMVELDRKIAEAQERVRTNDERQTRTMRQMDNAKNKALAQADSDHAQRTDEAHKKQVFHQNELNTKLDEAQTKQRELTDKQDKDTRKLANARQAATDAITKKEQVQADKAKAADDKRLHTLNQMRDNHIVDADAKMKVMQGEMDAQVHLNDLVRQKLDAEQKYREAKLHSLEAEHAAELRNSQLIEQRMRMVEKYHQRLQRGVGLIMGAGVAGAGVAHAVHSMAEVGNKMNTSDQQLMGMGINDKLLARVREINRQQAGLGKGIDYKEANDTFKMLHAVLGGPEAVLGKDGKDTSVLTLVNKFKVGMQQRYNLSDSTLDNAIRAAELGSASNRPDGKAKTREERIEHFESRLRLIMKATEATGGTLRVNEVLAGMKTLQANKFGLSDDGFLKLAFVMQELGGGRTGTAVNGLMTNMLMGQQAAYKNMGMAKLGLVNIHDKSIEFTKDGKGIKSFNPMTAFVQGNLLSKDPHEWIKTVYMPKLQAAMKADGKAWTPENAQLWLNKNIMGSTGRQTSQGLVSIMFQQSQRIEDDFLRAKNHAEDIETVFDKVSNQYKFQAKQTSIEWENLQNQLSQGVLPVVTGMLKVVNPTLRAIADVAKNNPEAVGAVFGAISAAIATGGLAGVVMVFSAVRGLAAISTLASTASALNSTATALGLLAVRGPAAAAGVEAVAVAAALPGLGMLGTVALGLTALAAAIGVVVLAIRDIPDPNNPFARAAGIKPPAPTNNPTAFSVPTPKASYQKTPLELLRESQGRTVGPGAGVSPRTIPGAAAPPRGTTTSVQVKPLIEGPLKAEMTLRVLVEAKGNTAIDQKNANAIAGSAVDRLHSAHPNLNRSTGSRGHGDLPPGIVPR
jgi:hypothetical protein